MTRPDFPIPTPAALIDPIGLRITAYLSDLDALTARYAADTRALYARLQQDVMQQIARGSHLPEGALTTLLKAERGNGGDTNPYLNP